MKKSEGEGGFAAKFAGAGGFWEVIRTGGRPHLFGAMEGGSGRTDSRLFDGKLRSRFAGSGTVCMPLFGGSIRMHAVKVPAMGNLLKQNAFFPRLRLAGGGEAVGREDPVIAPVQVVGVPFVLDRGKGAVRRQGGGMTAFRFFAGRTATDS